MSNVTVVQLYDSIFIGSDSAISAKIDEKSYRIGEDGKKLFVVDDKVIFCSGDLNLSYLVMERYSVSKDRSIARLAAIAKDSHENYGEDEFSLDIIAVTMVKGKSVVYQVSPYAAFEVIKRELSSPDQFGIWTGGIKTRESSEIANQLLLNGNPIDDLFKEVFSRISGATIGGTLTVYHVSNGGIRNIVEEEIVENDYERLNIDKHLIVGEYIYGTLGAFAKVTASSIIVGADNAKVPDNVIQSSSNWNTIYDRAVGYVDGEVDTLTEYVKTNVGELNVALAGMEGKLDLYASDNMISLAEAQGLALALAQVSKESLDIISVAATLSITTEKTTYQTALTNLVTEMNKWVNQSAYPKAITETDRTNIKNLFSNVQNYKSILLNKISSVRQAQANAYADTSLQAAKVYSDTTLVTAQGYSNTLNSSIRNDLRITAALPTSLALDGNGITATVAGDATKFARMDYRGLYIQKGALQITSTDGTVVIDGSGVNASKIYTGSLNGIYMTIGTGNNVFKADANGIYLGSSVFASAPFSVTQSGNVIASNITLSGVINSSKMNNTDIVGGTLTIGSGSSIFKADDNGIYLGSSVFGSAPFRVNKIGDFVATNATLINANISGNINMTSGSMSWGNINSDPVATGALTTANGARDGVAAIGSGTYSGTFINGKMIYAPTLQGGSIIGNTITGSTIIGGLFKTSDSGQRMEFNTLGLNSFNGSNQLHGVRIESSNFSSVAFWSNSAYKGAIESINGGLQISTSSGNVVIQAGDTTQLRGKVDFSSATVTGLVPVFG